MLENIDFRKYIFESIYSSIYIKNMGYFLNLLEPKQKEKSYFLKKGLLPILTKQPFDEYNDGNVPTDDIYSIQLFASYEQFSVFDLRMQGFGKTQLMGRAIPYFHEFGWRQVVFAQKGHSFLDANKPIRRVKLLKDEEQIQLPFSHLIPSFVLKNIPDASQTHSVFSPKIINYKDLEEFLTIGFSSSRQAQYILNKIEDEGSKVTVDYLLKCLDQRGKDYYKVHAQTRDALYQVLSYLKGKAFFDEEKADLVLGQEWKEGKIPIISSFSADTSFNSAIFGKIIKDEFLRSKDKRIKMVYGDDCHSLMPSTKDIKDSVSMSTLQDKILSLGRESRWGTWFATQFPDLINPNILAMFRPAWKILGTLPFSENLERIVPKWIKYELNDLVYEPENNLRQSMLLRPDNKIVGIGYQLGSRMGHASNL